MDISNVFDDGIALFSAPAEEISEVEEIMVEDQEETQEVFTSGTLSNLEGLTFYESVTSGELQYLTVTDITGSEMMNYSFGSGAFIGMLAAGVLIMISFGVAAVLRVFRVV